MNRETDTKATSPACPTCKETTCPGQERKPDESAKDFLERQALAQRLCQIRRKILVLSGKGGVGKSTVAVNLAVSLAHAGKTVGLLDIDIHGPSVPRLLGLGGRMAQDTGQSLLPMQYAPNLKVMSIGFLLQNVEDAVIWRGPMKYGVIKQFLRDVEWGPLDYLIVDSPPGTGDEPLSIVQLISNADGAIVVTTPQNLSVDDVRRCITFCRQVNLPVLGVIENMSGLLCPHCGGTIDVFKSGGGRRMASEMGVQFLGGIPIDPQIVKSSDAGTPYAEYFTGTETAAAFRRVIAPILENEAGSSESDSTPSKMEKGNGKVRIAIPLSKGKLSMHFGHCEEFALIDADPEQKTVVGKELIPAPDHQPGLLPQWLSERGVTAVIAGGMGQRALSLFEQQGIEVRVGAPSEPPKRLVQMYLEGNLPAGDNVCDHQV